MDDLESCAVVLLKEKSWWRANGLSLYTGKLWSLGCSSLDYSSLWTGIQGPLRADRSKRGLELPDVSVVVKGFFGWKRSFWVHSIHRAEFVSVVGLGGWEVKLASGEWRSVDGMGVSDNLSLPGFIARSGERVAIELSQTGMQKQSIHHVSGFAG